MPLEQKVSAPTLPPSHLAEKQQLVQLLVEAGGGLVDGGDNGAPPRCQLS